MLLFFFCFLEVSLIFACFFSVARLLESCYVFCFFFVFSRFFGFCQWGFPKEYLPKSRQILCFFQLF